MSEPFFQKCKRCCGTGKTIFCEKITPCPDCDGTGNALVDGEEMRYRRRLREIEDKQQRSRIKP